MSNLEYHFRALGSEPPTRYPSVVPNSTIPRCARLVSAVPDMTCFQGDYNGFMEIFQRGTSRVGTAIRVGAPFHLSNSAAPVLHVETEVPDVCSMSGYYLVAVQLWHDAPLTPPRYSEQGIIFPCFDVGAIPDVCRSNMEMFSRYVTHSQLPTNDNFEYHRTCLIHIDHSMQAIYDAIADAEGWPSKQAVVSIQGHGELAPDETLGHLLAYAAYEGESGTPCIDWPDASDLGL